MKELEKAIKERRAGEFDVNRDLLYRAPAAFMKAIEGALIIRAEFRFENNCFRYVAYHPQFYPVPEGEDLPRYLCSIQDLRGGNYHITWRRA